MLVLNRDTPSEYVWRGKVGVMAGDQPFNVLVGVPVMNPLGATLDPVAAHMYYRLPTAVGMRCVPCHCPSHAPSRRAM